MKEREREREREREFFFRDFKCFLGGHFSKKIKLNTIYNSKK